MIKFRANGKLYYAVTEETDDANAIKAVIRYKKDKLSNMNKYCTFRGVIRKRKDQYELWHREEVKGAPCIAVYRV